jgi:hypothetical protein
MIYFQRPYKAFITPATPANETGKAVHAGAAVTKFSCCPGVIRFMSLPLATRSECLFSGNFYCRINIQNHYIPPNFPKASIDRFFVRLPNGWVFENRTFATYLMKGKIAA